MSLSEIENLTIQQFLDYEEALTILKLMRVSEEKDAEMLDKLKSKSKG